MKKTEQLRLEQIKVQQQASDLVRVEAPTEEQRREIDALITRQTDLNKRVALATISEANDGEQTEQVAPPTDKKEWTQLCKQYSITRALSNPLKMDGIEKEVAGEMMTRAAELPIPDGAIPVPFITMGLERTETRADTPTTLTGLTGVDYEAVKPILPRLFPNSVMSKLGVIMATQNRGNATYPIVDSGATINWVGEAAGSESKAMTTTEINSTAKTYTANYQISPQALRLQHAGVEQAMRRDLAEVITRGLDTAALTGSGTNNQPQGLITALTEMDSTAQSFTYDILTDVVRELENNNYTSGYEDVALCLHPSTKAYAVKTIWDAGSGMTHYDKIKALFSKVAISNKLPTSGVNATALVATAGNSVLTTYGGGSFMITDPYTDSAKGITRYTIMGFADFSILRAGGYTRILVKNED